MHHGPIRRGPPGRRPGDILVRGVWINAGREQARLQGALAQGLDGGKAVEAGRLGPLAIVAHRRARHPTRRANRLVAQAECQTEAQDLLDPSHLRPLPRHPFLPAKPVAEQDGMRRSQKSDTAALNPQLWRIGPKRMAKSPKSLGELPRNRGADEAEITGGLSRDMHTVDPGALAAYAARFHTRYEQLDNLRRLFGYTTPERPQRRELLDWMLPVALAT